MEELEKEIRTCGNCDYFNPEDKDGEWGRCQRFPPVPFKIGDVNSWKFPKVHKETYCGEWTQQIVEKMKIEVEGADNEGI